MYDMVSILSIDYFILLYTPSTNKTTIQPPLLPKEVVLVLQPQLEILPKLVQSIVLLTTPKPSRQMY